jgi:hypothetical protein
MMTVAPACTTVIVLEPAQVDSTGENSSSEEASSFPPSLDTGAEDTGDTRGSSSTGDDVAGSGSSTSTGRADTTSPGSDDGGSSPSSGSEDSSSGVAPLLHDGEACDDAASCESGACVRGVCSPACDLDEPATCGAYQVCLPAPGLPGCVDTGPDGDASVIAGEACTPQPNPAANVTGDLDVFRFDAAPGSFLLQLQSPHMTLTIIDASGADVTTAAPLQLDDKGHAWQYAFSSKGQVWIIAQAGIVDTPAIYFFCSTPV